MTKNYDFDVTITCRHDECNEQFKQSAVDELLKLTKYHGHIIDGDITLDRQNTSYKAEISLRVPGHTLIASHEDYKMNKAFDSAYEKTKTQLKKIKDKIVDHRPAHELELIEVVDEDDEMAETFEDSQ